MWPRAPIINKALLFLFILFLILGSIVFFFGYYPIVKVNDSWIFAYNLTAQQKVLGHYKEILSTQATSSTLLSEEEEKAFLIDHLIEQRLLKQAVEAELGDQVEALVKERLSQFSLNMKAVEVGTLLYGVQGEEFKRIVLIPEIYEDLLSSHLFLQSRSLEEYRSFLRKNSKIKIFVPGYTWDGERVRPSS